MNIQKDRFRGPTDGASGYGFCRVRTMACWPLVFPRPRLGHSRLYGSEVGCVFLESPAGEEPRIKAFHQKSRVLKIHNRRAENYSAFASPSAAGAAPSAATGVSPSATGTASSIFSSTNEVTDATISSAPVMSSALFGSSI